MTWILALGAVSAAGLLMICWLLHCRGARKYDLPRSNRQVGVDPWRDE